MAAVEPPFQGLEFFGDSNSHFTSKGKEGQKKKIQFGESRVIQYTLSKVLIIIFRQLACLTFSQQLLKWQNYMQLSLLFHDYFHITAFSIYHVYNQPQHLWMSWSEIAIRWSMWLKAVMKWTENMLCKLVNLEACVFILFSSQICKMKIDLENRIITLGHGI